MSVEFDVKCTNISIHALREEGDYNALVRRLDDLEISIHALREEGDRIGSCRLGGSIDFYPRPPRGGRRLPRRGARLNAQFLSTPSARRATLAILLVSVLDFVISIHALREEGDVWDFRNQR